MIGCTFSLVHYLYADYVQFCLVSYSQFRLWPLALGDNRHDSRSHPARRLFECLMRRTVLVVKVVIVVVLEDGLRHNCVTLAERG